MAMLYFKCKCGNEQRQITEMDKTDYVQLPNGRWRFDPEAKAKREAATGTTEIGIIHFAKCETCGADVMNSDDPKAVRSFVKFDFFED